MRQFFYDKDILWEMVEQGTVKRKIKAYDKGIMMVEVCFENGGIGTPHEHPHAQTTYCLEGSFEFTVGDETKVIQVGDTIYMPPDVVHGCRVLTEKGRVLDVFAPCREDFLKK